jgi:hypothetical protein
MGEAIDQDIGGINQVLFINPNVISALEELRHDVENINKWGSSPFGDRVIAQDEVLSCTVDGICYGYKLHDKGAGLMEREIMIKPVDGGGFEGWDQSDLDKVAAPVLEVFFKEGYSDIKTFVIQGCLVFRQQFQISYLFEKNPGIVTPGRKW